MATIQLGGKTWRIIQDGTLERILWTDRQAIESGLSAMLRQAASSASPEGPQGRAAKIWEAISRSNRAFEFLGALIIPDQLRDEDWTPEIAASTAAAMKKLTAPEDHARIRTMLAALVTDFFVAARRSAELFESASGPPAGAAA